MPVEPFVFVVLVLCAARAARFFVYDSLIGANPDAETPFSKALDKWAWTTNGDDRSWVRGKVAGLLVCPHCLGFHLSWIALCAWTRLWPWELGVEGWIVAVAVAGGQSLLSSLDRKMVD